MRVTPCLFLLVLIGVALPAPASAHLESGLLAVDFEARVEGISPGVSGVRARVLGGDQRLVIAGSAAVLLAVPTVLGLLEAPHPRAPEQQGVAEPR
jgi:hypothetical protein